LAELSAGPEFASGLAEPLIMGKSGTGFMLQMMPKLTIELEHRPQARQKHLLAGPCFRYGLAKAKPNKAHHAQRD
jgi:hypothetical protein